MADGLEKVRRQREILAVIAEDSIASQSELGRALRRRGYPATQATLSRDLKELHVARIPVAGAYRYSQAVGSEVPTLPAASRGDVAPSASRPTGRSTRGRRPRSGTGSRRTSRGSARRQGARDFARAAAGGRLREVAVLEVTGLDANEIGVVIRTLAGRAPGVAVWLDGLKDPDILGTIAGDDTILVLPRTTRKTARLRASLARTLGLD